MSDVYVCLMCGEEFNTEGCPYCEDLTPQRDYELDEMVACHIEGWSELDLDKAFAAYKEGVIGIVTVPEYSLDINIITNLVQKEGLEFEISSGEGGYWVEIIEQFDYEQKRWTARGDTLARTMCIALLRAKGVDVE